MEQKTAQIVGIKAGKCRVCGCCVRSCLRGALVLGRKCVLIDPSCVGCGACVKSCPFDALELVQRY